MNKKELKDAMVARFQFNLNPFFNAVVDECCENVVNSVDAIPDDNKLSCAIIAFHTSLSALKATVSAALEFADTVTVNYRNQSFVFDKSHPLMLL